MPSAPDGSCLPPPDDDGPAEAQPPHLDLVKACGAPPRELAVERVAPPEVADRAAEEVADLAPAVVQEAAGHRQHTPHVRLPERVSEASGDAELERRDDTAAAYHAGELCQGCPRVGNVA